MFKTNIIEIVVVKKDRNTQQVNSLSFVVSAVELCQ